MLNELDAEVIVVGGSVSGVGTALPLAMNGIKTIVFDKAKFPRRKACASGITGKGLEEFSYIKPFLDCNVYKSSLISPNLNDKISFTSENLDKPLLAMALNRTDFDNKLLNYLISTTDCKVKMGTEVVNVQIKNDKAVVLTRDGKKYSSLMVVGADSTVSTVAKSLKIGLFDPKLKSKKKHILNISKEKDIIFDNSEKAKKNKLEVLTFMSFNDIKGYAWLFPKKDRVNIGVIVTLNDARAISETLEKFEKHLVEIGEIPKNVPKENHTIIAGAMLPAKSLYKKRIHKRVLLVGDAGGFCLASSGEGIVPSLQSGKIASDVISSLIKKYRTKKEKNQNSDNIFSKSNLKKYKKITDKAMKNEFRMLYMAQKVLINPKFNLELIKWCKEDEKLMNNIFKSFYGEPTSLSFKLAMVSKYIKFKLKKKGN